MSRFTKEMINDYADKLLIGLTEEENRMVLEEFDEIDKNIDLITNGSETSNEVEVLSSTKNEKVINELKTKYDVILISTPPVIGTNGTIELSKYTDLNLLISTHEKTKINDVKTAVDNYDNNSLLLK